jgi:drug/metabolite transporter (DMT)-like permease
MATASPDNVLLAVTLRLVSVLLFAGMNTLIKLCEAGGASLGEILFFRQAGAAILMVLVISRGPGMRSVATSRLPAHVLRAVLGLCAMTMTFSTILALPLAESTTIGFTMPIFATILGALVLGEPTGWHRWGAVMLGFVGVLIVAQPGTGHFPLIGALTESTTTTVFWFSTLSLVPLGIVYSFVMQLHGPLIWLLLASVGLVGGAAQLAMTGALRFGPVSVVVPMDYSSLLWATLSGWVVFGVLPDAWTWVGAPVIIASGLYIVWREHVRHRAETDQAVTEG